MDKKNLHRQGFSKALNSENRKSSDVSKQQQGPRNARRRENSNLSNSKIDPQRITKQGYAKTRPNVDKRPKPRGCGGTNNGGRSGGVDTTSTQESIVDPSATSSTRLAEDDDSSVDGDYEIELNSVYAQGSKKQNLNHLLNFHYISKENENSNGYHVSGSGGGHNVGHNRHNLRKHRYNKEQFLQANFQFVISSDAESKISAALSPDTLVDWSLIEQINIQTTEEPQCPICLYPPVAAKLTRCGHAYCWPCILHYLALTDKSWRKCPICYDAIHIADLKSTVIVQQTNFAVGDCLKLHLMRRKKGSLLVEKVEEEEAIANSNLIKKTNKIPHISAEMNEKRFSKFLLASYYEVLTIIEREKAELELGLDETCPEFVFIQQALDLLEGRKSIVIEKLEGKLTVETCDIENTTMHNENKTPLINTEDHYDNDNNCIQPEMIETLSVVNEDCNTNMNCNTAGKEGEICSKPSNSNSNSSQKMQDASKYYHFYQSIDGQNIFLHPLNVKMLQTHYGYLNYGPITIEAKILQKESQSMDDNLRKKFSCLGHLPLTCQFEIVEVQLEPPIISKAVLDAFKDDILMRQKIRKRRAREEMKREKEINERNERQMGKLIARSANIDIQSPQQFPTCGYDEFPNTFSFDLNDSPPPIPPLLPPSPSQQRTKFTSFANILSKTTSKKEFWPSLAGPKGSTVSPVSESKHSWSMMSKLGNGGGSSSVASGGGGRISENESNSDINVAPANSDLSLNSIRQTLGDAIADALLHTKSECVGDNNCQTTTTNTAVGNNGGGSKKKKNKNKKMLVFSTGMNFNGN